MNKSFFIFLLLCTIASQASENSILRIQLSKTAFLIADPQKGSVHFYAHDEQGNFIAIKHVTSGIHVSSIHEPMFGAYSIEHQATNNGIETSHIIRVTEHETKENRVHTFHVNNSKEPVEITYTRPEEASKNACSRALK